jgi:uncharacterized membrane protein (TIGR02234 family)
MSDPESDERDPEPESEPESDESESDEPDLESGSNEPGSNESGSNEPGSARRPGGGRPLNRLLRHGLATAVLGALAGSALPATAAAQPWLTGAATASAPGGRVSGSTAAPLVLATGLVGLAGAGALLATGGVLRRLLGVLLALLGAAATASATLVVARPAATYRTAAVPGVDTARHAITLTAWPFLAVVGLLLVTAAAVLTAVAGRGWPTLGRRYERAGSRSRGRARRPGPGADWDDLDAGRDPTIDGVDGEGGSVRATAFEPATVTETEQRWRSATRTATPPPGGTAP